MLLLLLLLLLLTTTCGQTKRAPAVINCTGAYPHRLGEMPGVELLLLAYTHAYVATEPIDGLEGLPPLDRRQNVAVAIYSSAVAARSCM